LEIGEGLQAEFPYSRRGGGRRPGPAVLPKVTDAQAAGALDPSLIGALCAGQQAQQSRLPDAVRPDQRRPRLMRQRQADASQDILRAETLGQISRRQQRHRMSGAL
jgi:hypothetical protein